LSVSGIAGRHLRSPPRLPPLRNETFHPAANVTRRLNRVKGSFLSRDEELSAGSPGQDREREPGPGDRAAARCGPAGRAEARIDTI
jgi:hypothetical protein